MVFEDEMPVAAACILRQEAVGDDHLTSETQKNHVSTFFKQNHVYSLRQGAMKHSPSSRIPLIGHKL